MFGRGLVLLRRGEAASTAGGLFQPIAVAVHREDADMVLDPGRMAAEPTRSVMLERFRLDRSDLLADGL